MAGIVLFAWLSAFLYALPPGAVTAEALRRGVQGGWPGVFGVEAGSVIGDALYGAIGLTGLGVLSTYPWAHRTLAIFGTLLLFYLAYSSFRSAYDPAVSAALNGRSFAKDFGVGALISILNPLGIAFWLSFGGALLSFGLAHPSRAQLTVFYIAFVCGEMMYALAFSAVVTWLRRFLTKRMMRAVALGCATALGCLAVAMGVRLL